MPGTDTFGLSGVKRDIIVNDGVAGVTICEACFWLTSVTDNAANASVTPTATQIGRRVGRPLASARIRLARYVGAVTRLYCCFNSFMSPLIM